MERCEHQDLPCDSCIEIRLIQSIAKEMASEEVPLKDPDSPGAEMERACMEEIFGDALREESETSGVSAKRKRNWRGSKKGRRFIDWERSRQSFIDHDYFGPNPVNDAAKFREMNRMSVRLFHRIEEALASRDEYFTQRRDATGKLGHTPRAKLLCALRQLEYGAGANSAYDYTRIPRATGQEVLKRFVADVNAIFGEEYLVFISSTPLASRMNMKSHLAADES